MTGLTWHERTAMLVLFGVAFLVCYQQVQANNGNFPESVVLYEYEYPFEANWALNQPALVANPDGRLHIFWGVVPLQHTAIYYTELRDGIWSEPVDVLLGPNMQTSNSNVSVVLDSNRYLHAIWHNNSLYYSYVHMDNARNPKAWAPPVEVVPEVGDSRLFVDDSDRLHIIYTNARDVTELLYSRCASSTCNWPPPRTVARAGYNEAIRMPHLWVSPEGILHTAWGQVLLPDGWPPTGVYYARSTDHGERWSSPTQLGGEGQGNPAIIGLGEEKLHLVWLATQPGRYYTHSLDAGTTWYKPRQFNPVYGGMLVGYVNLVKDNAQQIHLFVGGSALLLHSVWREQTWSPFEPIGRGESAMAAITKGNLLHFVWLNPSTLHYTSRVIQDVPAIAPSQAFQPQPDGLNMSEEIERPKQLLPIQLETISSATSFDGSESPSLGLESHSAVPLFWGLGSAFLVIVSSVWIYWLFNKFHRR